MSKTPNFDAKIQTVLAATKPDERTCVLTGEKWTMTEEEIGWYQRNLVPPNKISPNTVWKWMAYFDAGFQFWWNKHFETGKPVLSFHHPASGVRVLPDEEWHAKDFSETFLEIEVQKPFFDQLRALQVRVPYMAMFTFKPAENSIALFSFGDVNSYFVFGCQSKNTFCATAAMNTESSSLVLLSSDINQCHHISHSKKMYRCRYARESLNCLESAFLFDCRNCEFCFGAANKRNKKYLWMNEQLSEEEWKRRRATVDLGRRDEVEKWSAQFDALLLEQAVWPENFNVSTEKSTGDYLTNAVRCSECFDSDDAPTDNYRCVWNYGVAQKGAFMWGNIHSSEGYMSVSCPNSNRTKFSYRSFRMDDCEYCLMCSDCRDCFGCIGLKKKRFCILNKQYDEATYWKKLDELKSAMLERGEYGSYIPVELSTTYVPEGGAALYCGATQEELDQIGGQKFEPSAEGATGEERMDASKLRKREEIPNSIDDVSDDWMGAPVYDEVSKRTFSFLKPELEHYRALRIAPPNTHFVRRMHEVSAMGQKSQFENRTCASCQKILMVSKSLKYPNRRIYCTACYLPYLEKNG